ncbi:molybdenum cofactor biosynthesis protein B [Enterobacter hormaechei subsp. xiangfangensis]|nr:molybdenum cofactor biosynthesis protein B [Enterobacter hormaechei subsp. xiangfangensis]
MSQVSAEFIPTRIAILTVSERRGEEDDPAIRAQVSQWIRTMTPGVLITGGPALPQATRRRKRCSRCSIAKWKASAKCSACSRLKSWPLQSRAAKACRTAWENIIAPQLDARTRPCNFHPHLKK